MKFALVGRALHRAFCAQCPHPDTQCCPHAQNCPLKYKFDVVSFDFASMVRADVMAAPCDRGIARHVAGIVRPFARSPMKNATPVSADPHPLKRWVSHPAVRVVIPLLITALALFVLHRMSLGTNLADVKRDARGYSGMTLGLSFAAMCVSYLALSLYDVIIMRSVSDVRLPLGVTMMTGASSMAVSNMLGLSWLTGGAIRYRVYAAFGVKIGAVAKLIATSWLAFLLGLFALIGALMVFHPDGLAAVLHLSKRMEVAGGFAILAVIATYFVWTARTPRQIGFGQLKMTLPNGRQGATLSAISIIDLAATAMTLYVLMPADLSQNFFLFFVVFVAAIAVGILSHAPGGLGIFEATMIAGLGAAGRSDALAALLIYRLIYTVLPFLFAVIGLAGAWAVANREKASDTSRTIVKAVGPIVPLVTAGLVMLSGAVLLISGNLPSDPARLGFLQEILPLSLIETSHMIGSVSGVLLMIVARGLYRRMFRAWGLAMALLLTGFVVSLLKGFDWEEAATLAGAMAVLWVFRGAFYRANVTGTLRLNWKWILSVSLLVAAISWIGMFAYSNVQYSDALWWKFAWKSDASRFLRATFAVAVVLSAFMLNSLLSRQSARLKPDPIPDVVRHLTAQATAAEANISLSGDKRFIITPDACAYIAYADTGHTLVAKGDPVGTKEAGIAAIWQLRELADAMGRRCAFYAVSDRYLPSYLDLGLQVLKIGEVARVELATFSLEGSKRKDWRHAKARIARDGYVFEVIKAADLAPVMDNLREVSDAWLALKKSEEKGFSLGAFHPDYMGNFDQAVIRHAQTGRIAAFANLMQTGDKSEVSLDLMRYDPSGPGMAMDALFADMLLWGKAQGFTWFSLGAAPLSGFESHRLASTWHRIGSFLYEHGEQFYRFEGLRTFKQKFDPVWSPEYLASSGRLDAARVLYEVSLLISRGAKSAQDQAPPHEARI
ncbi:phosphatidylglycerol lysyltransferase [Celeribacter marinus]|uniref:Phosphatidylglycerol lysyltransferase n=2 Tax=Celeribacter marinus TaxID=1397108 RepID=A0A0N7HIU3_9RHOB|nr:alanylphosphatidylglycerol synthase [Celeribacter marinus]SFK85725.1 phosphatidylglycerol lysyltransferase [Celeribacter marinus]